jgi:hypothetical protein
MKNLLRKIVAFISAMQIRGFIEQDNERRRKRQQHIETILLGQELARLTRRIGVKNMARILKKL